MSTPRGPYQRSGDEVVHSPDACPKCHEKGSFSECFAPFRYCPIKGCERSERDDEPAVAPALDRDDVIRSMLDMAQKRAASAPAEKPLDVGSWPRIHRHYTDANTCEHGERLHVGWLELGMEAENAQQLLDFAGIPDGEPQGRGDVDWRVAEAVLRLHAAEGALSAIAQAHARETAPGGMVGDYCIECERRWPCPTYRWANGERDANDCWDPADDELSTGDSGSSTPGTECPCAHCHNIPAPGQTVCVVCRVAGCGPDAKGCSVATPGTSATTQNDAYRQGENSDG